MRTNVKNWIWLEPFLGAYSIILKQKTVVPNNRIKKTLERRSLKDSLDSHKPKLTEDETLSNRGDPCEITLVETRSVKGVCTIWGGCKVNGRIYHTQVNKT